MAVPIPYVLFYCDECDKLTPAITIFKTVHPTIELHTSSNPEELMAKIHSQQPDLILVYLDNPDKDYMSLVKEIRSSIVAEAIPLLIYKTLPTDLDLTEIFKKSYTS